MTSTLRHPLRQAQDRTQGERYIPVLTNGHDLHTSVSIHILLFSGFRILSITYEHDKQCVYLHGIIIPKWPINTHNILIGRIRHGFDFLGCRFSPAGLGIARQTIDRFQARMARLYEQGTDACRIGQYAKRWWHEMDATSF